MIKKFFQPLWLLFFLLNFLPCAHAEIKIIETTGEYTMDKNLKETLADATEHAREDARRLAANEAGYFIKTFSQVENFKIKEDRFSIVAATIMEDVEPEDVRLIPVDDGKSMKVTCRIKVKVDTAKIDPEKIMASELQYQNLEDKDKIVKEKDAEIAKWKSMYEQAVSEKQKLEIQNEFDRSQQQFLIAKYERDLDLYDLDKGIDWQSMAETAGKLQAIDPLNATAFRATIYAYREEGDLKKSVDYCNKILSANCPADTAIEACTQLGDIYYNELNDKASAKKFIDKGIALCKKNYSAAMIEKLVNGTNFEISAGEPVGKTNTIRELYVLKSDIEKNIPAFKVISKAEKMTLLEDKFYDIKYRTDW